MTARSLPAGQDKAHPPEPVPRRPFKTPLVYLRERRSEVELDALLNATLDRVQAHRRAEWAKHATASGRAPGYDSEGSQW